MAAIAGAGVHWRWSVGALLAAAGAAQAGKLDHGLDGDRPLPVFVRMADQLFAAGGEFEAFCAERGGEPRTRLRAEVLAELRRSSDRSWDAVHAVVDELVGAGSVRDVRRFWIVNGFACDADAAACRRLAALDAVAFVYLQRQPGQWVQHRTRPRPQRWREERALDQERARKLVVDEEPEFDSDGLTVPWNLERLGAPQAWRHGACGQGVVVALCDSGLLVTPPLVQALWRNPAEAANGEDDDGDGRVDDLFGWDCDGDTPYVVGDGQRSHGSMCAGIIAGRPWGQPRTVTGVAPRARLMVLRGMGRLSAYEYAAEHGADVISLSYMWIGFDAGHYRGVFRTAHEHLAACGVVAVGGAGNFRQSHPAGQQIALPKDIPCVIAAGGLLQDGAQAPFSSEGPCTWSGVRFFDDHPADAPLSKPDVTAFAGGYPVWHWTDMRGRQVKVVWDSDDGIGLIEGPRGNSFSGPHAAGVAALMLSANRELPAWRVKELMEATCRDLGPQGRDCAFGAGLLRAHEAVQAARAAK